MPRQSIHRLSQQVLERASADASERRIHLRVEFRMDHYSKRPGELLGALGGEWDLEERRFVGPGTKARVWTISELQRDSVVYYLAWLRAYITGDWSAFQGQHGQRPFSLWTVGGRRRGKTHFGLRALPGFTIACPEAWPSWLVAPIEDDFDEGKELHREWVSTMPPSWYEWNRRELYIQMVHGPRILMLSAHDAEKLKQGGFGYAFWNEVQKSRAGLRGLNNLRGGAADTGTLVHLAANPPREPEEYWIDEILEKLERGEVEGKLFDYRGDNPHVNEAALDSMKSEMSLRDYQIEREGARLPRPDIVLHAFRDGAGGNVREVPTTGETTEEFLRRRLGRPFGALISCDFQHTPHQVGIADRFFEDPADPTDALSWTTDEAVVDQGDENDLIDELESLGFRGTDTLRCMSCDHEMPQLRLTSATGASCPKCRESWAGGPGQGVEIILATAVVADASGSYQRADREFNRRSGYGAGRGSYAMFEKRGWRHIFKPDPYQERNPKVEERVLVANARLCTGDGRRHAFIAPSCVKTIEAVKRWPNAKWGGPSRHSPFAHVGDGWTYGKYRLWPRRVVPKADSRIRVVNLHGRDDRAWVAGSGDDDRPPFRRE